MSDVFMKMKKVGAADPYFFNLYYVILYIRPKLVDTSDFYLTELLYRLKYYKAAQVAIYIFSGGRLLGKIEKIYIYQAMHGKHI